MAVFSAEKVLSALPSELTPHTVYAVRVGTGFDLFITNADGSAAIPLNQSGGGGQSVPLYIASDETFTLQENTQVAYGQTIICDGLMDISGLLVRVG